MGRRYTAIPLGRSVINRKSRSLGPTAMEEDADASVVPRSAGLASDPIPIYISYFLLIIPSPRKRTVVANKNTNIRFRHLPKILSNQIKREKELFPHDSAHPSSTLLPPGLFSPFTSFHPHRPTRTIQLPTSASSRRPRSITERRAGDESE